MFQLFLEGGERSMRMYFTGIMVLTMLMGVVFLSSAAENDGDLSVGIYTNQKQYRIGEPIYCTLILGNVGDQSLVVNKRLVVNYSSLFPHEVLFHITDPDGNLLDFIPMVTVSIYPKSEHFITLRSSQFVRKTWEISRYFSFEKKGKYNIQAVYENYYQPEGMKVWKGSITSNVVEIEVST